MEDSIKCPECGTNLEPITHPSGSMLNFEQWSADRAGDYCCPNLKCPGIAKINPANLAKNGLRCFWKRNLVKHKFILREEKL